MFQLSLTDIFVEAYSYYAFEQNKHQQQSLPFNRIYKSKVISRVKSTDHVDADMFQWEEEKALTFRCFLFHLQTNILKFSIQIMFLYTLNLKGKHRIRMKWIQVILRARYLVKRSGNVHKYENQRQFVTILLGLWQLKEINLTLLHVFLNYLMTYAVLKSHGAQQEDIRSCKPQSCIWWKWVGF